jgi:hypothetical protein
MSENLYFSEDNEEELEKVNSNLIFVKKVRTVNSVHDLPIQFPSEVTRIDYEDVVTSTLADVIKMIQGMAPNRIVVTETLPGKVRYIICDCELRLKDYILMRGNKLIATGSYEQMQIIFLDRIQKEYPGKFDTMAYVEIDETMMINFCKMYFNKPNLFRIINLNP